MTNKFKAGDQAIIVNTPFPDVNGTKVTIISAGKLMYNIFYPNGAIIYEVDIYLTDLSKNVDRVGVPEPNLKPIYDGDEKTSWKDCVFKPKELVTCQPESPRCQALQAGARIQSPGS